MKPFTHPHGSPFRPDYVSQLPEEPKKRGKPAQQAVRNPKPVAG